MKKTFKLKPFERDELARLHNTGLSIRSIAKILNRSPSTISRELKRNRFKKYYVSIHAQSLANTRKSQAGKRHPLKNKSVYKYALKKLRLGWSPEQIAGRLKLIHPHNPHWHIHWETIYRFIYSKENQNKKLWEYLPRKQKKRRKKHGRKAHRVRIPDRVSIHLRSKEVETRLVFGHWEGDSIEGKNHRSGIHTQVERKTRFLKARLVNRLSASEALIAQAKIFSPLPKSAKKSTTVDNGKEFTNHKQFELPVFFCDPYASWQKATNENTNGLIRRYLPKKTDFRKITQDELDDIIWEINNRPKKCLGFRTPQEEFNKELGVAIGSRM
jgi:IS30 family transposase